LPKSKLPLKHLRASDLKGVAQLATQATLSIASITEGVHQSVWRTLGMPGGRQPGQTRGITGLVYKSVSGVTQLVGKTINIALTALQPLLESTLNAPTQTAEREAVLAALNGVMGDRLQASDNPLATRMTLRYRDAAIDVQDMPPKTEVNGKILLMIHGLCMNDLQWTALQDGQAINHGEVLATALGYTPVYLRYNTGLHVSQNGRELAALLAQLLVHWPVKIKSLDVLAHSMGGLVIRSAVNIAKNEAMQWTQHLKRIVFLGTPHHGAPLERAGNWVDVLLGATPYSKPFTQLAQLRSAGITDLRYGFVSDADWQGQDRFKRKPDKRAIVALPHGVQCYAIAATTAAKRSLLAERLLGDGLVPLHSALGQHDAAGRCLTFDNDKQHIAYRTNHMQLLSSPTVTEQLMQWLNNDL
jgi:pimeloyl-ACP methyl ester carboxylesterase